MKISLSHLMWQMRSAGWSFFVFCRGAGALLIHAECPNAKRLGKLLSSERYRFITLPLPLMLAALPSAPH